MPTEAELKQMADDDPTVLKACGDFFESEKLLREYSVPRYPPADLNQHTWNFVVRAFRWGFVAGRDSERAYHEKLGFSAKPVEHDDDPGDERSQKW